MRRKDFLPNLTVKVEGGSGCLFQPVNDSYSYVLTAKHVINGNNAPEITRQTIDSNDNLLNEPITIIGQPFLHKDINKDAAIIKVNKVEGIDSLIRAELSSDNKDNYYLCGHPLVRKQGDFSFRENALTIENKKQYGYIEAGLSLPADHSEIVGQSGGGIIQIENGCFLLAGIQKKMSAPGNEILGRIDFMPLSFFDEIIGANQTDLSSLFPPYIKSFDKLLNEIFPLPTMLGKKELIQNELRVIAKALCADFSPSSILDVYKDVFLIHGTDKAMINHKHLWVAFLELLSINQLHQEEKLKLSELKKIHKKRKLYFADTDDWTKKLENIYKTDLSEIEKDGCIVVAASKDNTPTTVEIPRDFILDIATIPRSEMNISNTVINPAEDLRIVHIYKFQSHIINNAIAFAKINASNSKKILRDETKELI